MLLLLSQLTGSDAVADDAAGMPGFAAPPEICLPLLAIYLAACHTPLLMPLPVEAVDCDLPRAFVFGAVVDHFELSGTRALHDLFAAFIRHRRRDVAVALEKHGPLSTKLVQGQYTRVAWGVLRPRTAVLLAVVTYSPPPILSLFRRDMLRLPHSGISWRSETLTSAPGSEPGSTLRATSICPVIRPNG